jgi:hypothetical protein
VSIVTESLMTGVQIPVGEKKIFLIASLTRPVLGVIRPQGVKRQGRESDHSPPRNA